MAVILVIIQKLERVNVLLDKSGKITTDVDSLRSEIRDKSVRVIDVRREDDYKQIISQLL